MTPYSATPLTDDQRAEVLRVMSECAANERHAFRTHLNGERTAALTELRDHERSAARQRDHEQRRAEAHRVTELRARAAAFARALELLDACWPTPDLAPRQAA